MESILESLNRLEDMLDSSNSLLFTGKVLADKEEIFSILAEVRSNLPSEIKQSKWVVEERNKILQDAQKEADRIVNDAKRELSTLVSEHEITKKAIEEADRIIDEANETAKQMRVGAVEYADDVLYNMERSVKETMEEIHTQFASVEDHLTETATVIHNNREELKRGRSRED